MLRFTRSEVTLITGETEGEHKHAEIIRESMQPASTERKNICAVTRDGSVKYRGILRNGGGGIFPWGEDGDGMDN